MQKRMQKLTELERELHTRDPLTQVQRCLTCAKGSCVNCVAHPRQPTKIRTPRRRRRLVHAEA